MKNLLDIKQLKIEGWDGDRWLPIIHGLDLHLDRSEVLGLIGESGAGKSTVGLASMGYAREGCKIKADFIKFDNFNILNAPEKEKRKLRGVRIAYVAQSAAAAFNPAFKLFNQYTEAPVQHGLMSFSQAKKQAIGVFKRLELPDPEIFGYRYPHQVSGGQLQRAMVAMAMACKPDIIIFDEPTTALDVTTQIEVLSAIKDAIRQYRSAAIYITHDLAVVAQLADRIMVLRHGKLVEEGSSRNIIFNPKEEYTKKLLSVRSKKKQKVQSSNQNAVILEITNLSAGYDKRINIIEDVNLKICRGKTIAVVGESGSGKSTLAKAITGLLPSSSGKIFFKERELSNMWKLRVKEDLRLIQMIYQMPDTALNPRHKVNVVLGRPLEFYFGYKGKRKKHRVLELLEMIELSEKYYDRFPSELSGGEKQRLCIARALAAEPELIICDEVTSALDQLVGEEILKLLQRLQDDLGLSYIFITHDLSTVKMISDEVVVMMQGKIVEQGTRDEIFTPPHHEYTEILLSSVPEMNPEWLDNYLEKLKNNR